MHAKRHNRLLTPVFIAIFCWGFTLFAAAAEDSHNGHSANGTALLNGSSNGHSNGHLGNGHAKGHTSNGHEEKLDGAVLDWQKGRVVVIRIPDTPYFQMQLVFNDGHRLQVPNVLGIGDFGFKLVEGEAHAGLAEPRLIDFDPFSLATTPFEMPENVKKAIEERKDKERLTQIYFYTWEPIARREAKQKPLSQLSAMDLYPSASSPATEDPRLSVEPIYEANSFINIRTSSYSKIDFANGVNPIPSIVVGRTQDSLGELHLALAFNPVEAEIGVKTTFSLKDCPAGKEAKNYGGTNGIFLINVLEKTKRRNSQLPSEVFLFPEKLGSWLPYPRQRDVDPDYFNEMSFAWKKYKGDGENFDSNQSEALQIVAYDDRAGSIHYYNLSHSERNDESKWVDFIQRSKLQRPLSYLEINAKKTSETLLPPMFLDGESFSQTGQLIQSESEGLVIQPAKPTKKNFLPIHIEWTTERSKRTTENKKMSWTEKKADHRSAFAEGPEELRSWISTESNYPNWKSAGPLLQQLFNKNFERLEDSEQTVHENQHAIFSSPDAVLKEAAPLRYPFLLQAADSYQAAKEMTSVASQLLYFVWPKQERFLNKFKPRFIEAARRLLKEQDGKLEEKYSLTVILDFSNFAITDRLKSHKGIMADALKEIKELTKEIGKVHFDFLYLLPDSSIEELISLLKDANTVIDFNEYQLSSWVDQSDRATWMANQLSERTGHKITANHVTAIANIIREKTKTPNPLDNWNEFANRLERATNWLKVSFSRPEQDIQEVARVVCEMMGTRPSDPFPVDTRGALRQIPQMFNADSPVHVEGALHNLEDVLVSFSRQLFNYGTYAKKFRSRPLVFAFIGNPGSGKTKLVSLLQNNTPHIALRTVNFSTSTKFQNAVGETILKSIVDAADELRFSPEPMKVLFLDEVTAKPEVLRPLLASIGDDDAKLGTTISLDGLIVIMALNTDETDDSRRLETMTLQNPSYPKYAGSLLAASLTSALKNSDVNSKVIKAAVSRVRGGVYYFKKRKGDSDESPSHVRHIVETYEQREGFRLIIPDETMAFVNKRVDESTDSYRGAGSAIESAIESAIADRIDLHGDKSLQNRVFLLKSPTDRFGFNYELVDILQNEQGIQHLLSEAYRLYVDALKKALHYRIGQINLALERAHLDDLENTSLKTALAQYTVFLEGLSFASSRPLFTEEDKKLIVQRLDILPPFSQKQAEKISIELQALWAEQMEHSFIKFHAQQNPLFLSLLPNMSNEILEFVQKNKTLDVDSIATQTREALLSNTALFFDSYQRLLAGSHLRPSDLPSGTPSNDVDRQRKIEQWAKNISFIFQDRSVQQGSSSNERQKKELALLKEIQAKWDQLQETVNKDLKSQRERDQLLMSFQLEAVRAIEDHCAAYSRSSKKDLMEFLKSLNTSKKDGLTDSETSIKERTDQLTDGVQDELETVQSHHQVVPLGVAFHLDNQLRNLILNVFEYHSPQARLARKIRSEKDQPTKPNSPVEESQEIVCKDLLLAPTPETGGKLRGILEKLNLN